MTTNKDLLKPEHGTIQAQDVHEIEKEPETDSAEKRNLLLSSFITVQIIRLMLETTLLQGVMISALPNDSGYVDFRVLLLMLIHFSSSSNFDNQFTNNDNWLSMTDARAH